MPWICSKVGLSLDSHFIELPTLLFLLSEEESLSLCELLCDYRIHELLSHNSFLWVYAELPYAIFGDILYCEEKILFLLYFIAILIESEVYESILYDGLRTHQTLLVGEGHYVDDAFWNVLCLSLRSGCWEWQCWMYWHELCSFRQWQSWSLYLCCSYNWLCTGNCVSYWFFLLTEVRISSWHEGKWLLVKCLIPWL